MWQFWIWDDHEWLTRLLNWKFEKSVECVRNHKPSVMASQIDIIYMSRNKLWNLISFEKSDFLKSYTANYVQRSIFKSLRISGDYSFLGDQITCIRNFIRYFCRFRPRHRIWHTYKYWWNLGQTRIFETGVGCMLKYKLCCIINHLGRKNILKFLGLEPRTTGSSWVLSALQQRFIDSKSSAHSLFGNQAGLPS